MKWWDLVWRLAQLALGQAVQELERWRWHMLQSLLMVMLAAVCGLTVLLLAALLTLLTFWETHRFEALWALVLGYALLAAWLVRRAGRLMALPSATWASQRASGGAGCACRGGAVRGG
jgi:uncharacterized membrane protein YqjE